MKRFLTLTCTQDKPNSNPNPNPNPKHNPHQATRRPVKDRWFYETKGSMKETKVKQKTVKRLLTLTRTHHKRNSNQTQILTLTLTTTLTRQHVVLLRTDGSMRQLAVPRQKWRQRHAQRKRHPGKPYPGVGSPSCTSTLTMILATGHWNSLCGVLTARQAFESIRTKRSRLPGCRIV